MKKTYVFAKKNVRGRDASARRAHDPRIREMAQTESGQNGGPFGVVRWSWPYKWDRS